MHQLESRLMSIALLQHRPDLLRLRLAQAIVQDVPSHQHDALLEKKLRKEREDTIRVSVGPAPLEVLQIGAELDRERHTKQSFCHWVSSLKCPPFLKTGIRKKGELVALDHVRLTDC